MMIVRTGDRGRRGRICFQFIIVISMEVRWRGALRFGRVPLAFLRDLEVPRIRIPIESGIGGF